MASLREYWQWQQDLYDLEEDEVPIYVTQGETKDFQPCPEGLHQAVCVDVIDKGIVDSPLYGKKHKLVLVWQVLAADDDGNPMVRNDGKRFQVQKWYTASIHKKSSLYRDLNIWRGKTFTPDEAAKFDVEKLIGANCQIQVIHAPPKDDGVVYANVQALVPYKGKDKAAALEYVRVKDRPTDDGNGNGSQAPAEDEEEALPF